MMKIAYAPIYCHPLPEGHRFPMLKYELIPEQLLYEGTISASQIHVPTSIDRATILLTHDENYLNKLETCSLDKNEIRKTGFPLSPLLVEREKVIMQGTIDMALHALDYGVGLNVAGGTHHAFTNRGEGFCLLNDIAIAANFLIHKKGIKKILIVDLDVHQGNGTAEIFHHRNDVFTFSIHGEHNYPLQKEKSTLDIGVPDKIGDEVYLELVETYLKQSIKSFQPEFLFYQCGVDILATDKLGRLSVSSEGCKERDRIVFETAIKNHLPICCAMGGGYSEDIKIIVDAHCNTFRLASELFH